MNFETPAPDLEPEQEELTKEQQEIERERQRFQEQVDKRSALLGISPEEYLRTYAYNEYALREGESDGHLLELTNPAGKFPDKALRLNTEQAIRSKFDTLTGLHNLKAYQNELLRRSHEHIEGRRLSDKASEDHQESIQEDYSIIYLDIDHFKRVNDEYGHPKGDEVIKKVAQTIIESIRREDFAARIGGEEMSVIVSGDINNAIALAKRIRKRVEGISFLSSEKERVFNITVSLGIADHIQDPDKHRAAADATLQIAKGNKQAFQEAVNASGVSAEFPEGHSIPDEQHSRNQIWTLGKVDGKFILSRVSENRSETES